MAKSFSSEASFLRHFETLNPTEQAQCLTDGYVIEGPPEAGGRPLSTDTLEFDWSSEARYQVSGDANQPNQTLTLSNESEDAADSSFQAASNVVTYTSTHTPDYIEIAAQTYVDMANNNAAARIAPELELLKNGTPLPVRSATGYMRHTNNHNNSSNSVSWVDTAPTNGDQYSLRAQQGSDQNEVANITSGHLALKAVEKRQITFVDGYA